MSTAKARSYRMTKRAEDVAQTRQRIVEATTELHSTVGPARTTVAGIAERAGVTRLTVYRHFPDDEALFAACSAHWFSQQPTVPNPLGWQAFSDPEERLRRGLAELYAFYRHGEQTLTAVYRDWDSIPASHRAGMVANNAALREALVSAYRRPSKRLKALAGHAAAFSTWRSLCRDNGLTDAAAVEAMVAMVRCGSGSVR